jgi:hypothetical protein
LALLALNLAPHLSAAGNEGQKLGNAKVVAPMLAEGFVNMTV